MAPKKNNKHTAFYELLGTTPDVTPEQLKKAYRRTALKLHPDRGGDPEAFKTMKAAYDVLNDPKKRQMYDKYGPEVVRVMDGDVGSPEAMMAALGQISKRERLMIVLVFAVVSMFVLLFPILLSLWWDGDLPKDSSWAIGVPVWLIHFLLVIAFFSFFKGPEDAEVDADAESRAMLRDDRFALNKLRFWFMFNTVLLLVFEVLFVMQLHSRGVGDWFIVIAPLLVFEVFNMLWTAAATPAQWLDMFHVGQTTTPGMYHSASLWMMIFSNIKWHVLRIITVCLAAWQADEGTSHSVSWFVVIAPLLVGIGVSCLSSVCAPLPPPSPSPQGEEEERAPSRTGRFCGWLCTSAPVLIMLTVAAAKLDGGSFSAFMIWIPLFVLVFCVCCCCSLSILLITPEAMQEAARAAEEEVDLEQGGRGSERTPMTGDAQSAPMYGSGQGADDVEVIFVSNVDAAAAAQAPTRSISAQDQEDMHKGVMVLE